MIKTFLSKYFLEVIPSVVATVLGAYIVTNYINAKPSADKAPAAAMSAPAKAASAAPDKDEVAAKAEAAAKAAAERVASEKAAADKAAAEKAAIEKMAAEKAEIRKAERAASEKREAEKREFEKREAERRDAEKREHALAKAAPAIRTPAVKPVEESAANPDANELARAAIARLRAEQPAALVQPAVKMPEQPVAPVAAAPASQPVAVPPMRDANIDVTVPSPAAVAPLPTATIATTPPVADVRASRLVPPADIPSRPLDLRARDDANNDGGSVVSDVMSATKSAFEAVLPR